MEFSALEGALSRDEAMTLVVLARALVRADGHISDPELDAFLELADAVGLDVFADALDRRDTATLSKAELERLANRVGEGNRVLVLEALLELGSADGLVAPEQELVSTLSRLWALGEPTLR